MDKKRTEGSRCSNFASLIILTELGWGSVLHGWRVPFTGTLLCFNQIFLLGKASQASVGHFSFLPLHTSLIAAFLKGLSPAGKRLTPMIAIAMQGALFNLGTLALGNRRLGRCAGAFIASQWGIVQPIALYLLLLGESFYLSAAAFGAETSRSFGIQSNTLYLLLAAWSLLRGVGGILSVLASDWISFERYEKMLPRLKTSVFRSDASSSLTEKAKGALKDLFRLSFLFALFTSAGFVYYSTQNAIASLLYLLQGGAFGLLCFFTLRLIPKNALKKYLVAPEKDAILEIPGDFGGQSAFENEVELVEIQKVRKSWLGRR